MIQKMIHIFCKRTQLSLLFVIFSRYNFIPTTRLSCFRNLEVLNGPENKICCANSSSNIFICWLDRKFCCLNRFAPLSQKIYGCWDNGQNRLRRQIWRSRQQIDLLGELFSIGCSTDFVFRCDISRVKSMATGLESIPLKFNKLILPLVLPCITHIYNTLLYWWLS
jgi:hypothetical protein